MTFYVALLRGINVGGKNQIKMADLAALFRSLGLSDVETYIQSGNVIFAASETDKAGLAGRLEDALSKTFGYDARLVLLSLDEMNAVVTEAPQGFGADPATYRYDVLFLRGPLTAADAIKNMPAKEGVDEVSAGAAVIYSSRLIARASQSHISRIVGLPIYPSLTIRNWNTTTKLLAMMRSKAVKH